MMPWSSHSPCVVAIRSFQARSFSGLRTPQMRVIRPSAISNAATFTVRSPRSATRPGRPLTDRTRSSMPGARTPMSVM